MRGGGGEHERKENIVGGRWQGGIGGGSGVGRGAVLGLWGVDWWAADGPVKGGDCGKQTFGLLGRFIRS